MKPQLRKDAYFAPVPEGAYWFTHQGPVMLTGTSSPNGSTTGPLPGWSAVTGRAHPAIFRRSGGTRRSRSCILCWNRGFQGVAGQQPGSYAAEVRFLDYFTDSAVARFHRYRNSRVLLIGAGQALVACTGRRAEVGAAQAGGGGNRRMSDRPQPGSRTLSRVPSNTTLSSDSITSRWARPEAGDSRSWSPASTWSCMWRIGRCFPCPRTGSRLQGHWRTADPGDRDRG